MTYAAISELALHVHEVCIGDTYSEGMYRVRVSLYSEMMKDDGGIEVLFNLIKKLMATPYQLVPRPQLVAEEQEQLMMLTDSKSLMINGLNLVNSWGRDKCYVNEICVFRIELPCYPAIWTDALYLKFDLMVLVDKVIDLFTRIINLTRSSKSWTASTL